MRILPAIVTLFLLPGAVHSAIAADHTLPLSAANVHWGYFSTTLSPVLTISSNSTVEVEMATHHGCDDYGLMIEGESVCL